LDERLAKVGLTPRQIEAISRVYCDGQTLHEAADCMGICYTRLNQLVETARRKLRRCPGAMPLVRRPQPRVLHTDSGWMDRNLTDDSLYNRKT
jgi:DNA-directed RNA polymerase sigma subunit (sigma70/sigma32)